MANIEDTFNYYGNLCIKFKAKSFTITLFLCLIPFIATPQNNLTVSPQEFTISFSLDSSRCNILEIKNFLPNKNLIVTNVRVEKNIWWLVNFQTNVKKPQIISWTYKQDLGLLYLKTYDNSFTGTVEIDLVSNLMRKEIIDSLTCVAYRDNNFENRILIKQMGIKRINNSNK